MKIGLIPIYVDYYEGLAPKVRENKERLLGQVMGAIETDHEVYLFEWVTSVAKARAAREKLRRTKPDCLIAFPLVAAFSVLSDELARGWHGPLVLLSAMAGTKVPTRLSIAKVVAENQSLGCQAIANGWHRLGIKFCAVHHIPGTTEGNAALRRLLRAIELHQQFGLLRIGLIGETFAGMTDVVLAAKQLEEQTGARIVNIPMKHVLSLMAKVPKPNLSMFEKRLAQTFALSSFSAREKEFSFRAAVAIQQLVLEKRLDCAAFNSHGPEGLKSEKLGLMCALGLTLATSSGCPMAEVGDLCTATAMWIGRKLGGAAFYTELHSAYMSDQEWLLLNSGEYDLQWLRPGFRPQLVPNTNFVGVNGRGASLCAPLRTGPATMINFTPTPHAEQPYRLLVCEGTVAKDWIPELGVVNARFSVNGNARAVYEQWLAAGPVHHSATSPGHLSEGIQTFCQLQNWAFRRVG